MPRSAHRALALATLATAALVTARNKTRSNYDRE